MEKVSAEDMINAEREKRGEQLRVLEATEGFSRLTPKQQRILEQSFYIQARAERGTDFHSKVAITPPDMSETGVIQIRPERDLQRAHEDGSYANPVERKYRISQNHIADWNCHAAILTLENEGGLDVGPDAIPDAFFEAEYHHFENLEELKASVEEAGFPAILHVVLPFNGKLEPQHSCLLLGHNKEDNVIAWEKEGRRFPYRIASLDEIWTRYGANNKRNLWGIRKLSEVL